MGSPHTMDTRVIQGLQVCDLNLENEIQMPTLYTKDNLPVSRSHIPTSDDISQYPHLRNIDIPQLDCSIELLIGNNVPDAYTPQQVRTGEQGTPHATKTRLGWILWNVVRNSESEHGNCGLTVMRTDVIKIKEAENMRELDQLVRQNMNIEFPEKGVQDRKEMSQEDKLFLKKVENSVEMKDGHYHIQLPFRNENIEMPDNHDYALKRLNSLRKKFEKNTQFYRDYSEFMMKVVSKGYAEKVPEEELQGPKGKTWFIPHHGVYHPRKPDKIRVVFDCAAKYQGVSLNDVLLQGPDLTNNLTGVLIKFRQGPVAIIGGVEAMYYQVNVHKEDKDFQRFYWWNNSDYNQKPEVYRMRVHLFGTVSSSSCASYALRKTAEDNRDRFESDIANMISDNFYVDDCLSSTESDASAIEQVKGITDLCSQGGFHIAKWVSNSRKVIESIQEENRSSHIKSLDLEHDDLPCERALGTYWIMEDDKLSFKIQVKNHSKTKRGILSVTSSVYDPLGFAAPVILPAKQLLQVLCKKNYHGMSPFQINC
ncbi:uncharacterized protein LOC124285766 [Haliotis rubra]|uniref:uncharacterized protein LOC124285766 n=1 Tax=Haliotis rubra TaxID=36100 RepID=UPI001EE56AB1|nr:uncharacterized protein LOC124285766 [Haliotis rubra]